MSRDIKDYRKTKINVTVYRNVERANTDSSNFARFLKSTNAVTVFQNNSNATKNLNTLCKNVKNRSMTYFSYAGNNENSRKITIQLGKPMNESRTTTSGVVFGILNRDFHKLKFNMKQKIEIIERYNPILFKKNNKQIDTNKIKTAGQANIIIQDIINTDRKEINDIMKDYVCDKFSMNDLLVSMSSNNPVINHLIFSVYGQKLNLTPKKMGLTGKLMTAEQLKTNVMYFLNNKYKNEPAIPDHFNSFFTEIESKSVNKKPQFSIICDLNIDYISSLNSEIFEIFSAYDLLHRSGFQKYRVYFPKLENADLYDYAITTGLKVKYSPNTRRLNQKKYFVSVKNNISVSKTEIEKIEDGVNKDPEFDYTPNRTSGNTLKPSVVFKNNNSIVAWSNWIQQHKNNKKFVHTSDNNNNRVYKIFEPAANGKGSAYTIDAIKNLGLSNGETGQTYITNYFKKMIKRLPNHIKNIQLNDFKANCVTEFINMVTPNNTVDEKYSKYIIQNLTGSTSTIQIICEKILEYNSKKQTDLKAEEINYNTNFVDIISYLVNRDRARIIFSTSKYTEKTDDNKLKIYFQNVMVPSSDVLEQTWIRLRSQGPKSSLGMDLTFTSPETFY